MSKANKKTTTTTEIRRQGRRVIPALRRSAQKSAGKVLTLGELIAAAFDTVGSSDHVAEVLSSRQMRQAIGKKIVFV